MGQTTTDIPLTFPNTQVNDPGKPFTTPTPAPATVVPGQPIKPGPVPEQPKK